MKQIRPAAVFIDAYTAPKIPGRIFRLPEGVDNYFGPPEEFFMMTAEQQHAYDEGGSLLPLIDDGNFGSILFWSPQHKQFVLKYVEAPDPPARVFQNWQQYLAQLMRDVAETDADDEELERVAKVIGFGHFERFLGHLNAMTDSALSFEEKDTRWDEFIDGISG